MDRIMFSSKPPYLYPLLNPDGTYKDAALYPGAPTYEQQLALAHANAAEQARRTAAAAVHNAYAAQAAAARTQAAAIQAARDQAAARAAAAARLAMLQPRVIPAPAQPQGNPWVFQGGAYRIGQAAPAPVYRPAYVPAPVPAPVYRPAPAPAPAPAAGGNHWTYNQAGYYVRK
ncbi:Protein of unknown function [Pyronema omphalodes CBS 100304]|uniref:Uncharacterized protein n=1 Tax=Pyronema omphalodes (strain CBS 100304) TaxID=1076935 RepID=U4LNK7_PYROM|nr:Protein of unknown function [Pyronema omphalodes CBS 100304]